MNRIILLLLTGAFPVLSQYQFYQQTGFADYGNGYNGYNNNNQQGSDFGLQQQSFFSEYNPNNNNNGANNGGVVVGNTLHTNFATTGLSAPAPLNPVSNYFTNEGSAVVQSSLRELEESYIRSLASPTSTKVPYLDPYGDNNVQFQQHHQPQHAQGVENYSGFVSSAQQFTNTHYNKNEHMAFAHQQAQLQLQQQQQLLQQPQQGNQAQPTPLTYGFPLVNPQISATNSIETPFGQREHLNGKFFDYSQKKPHSQPNFPEFPDTPPIPQEPYIPPDSDDPVATPNQKLVLPTPGGVFGNKPSKPLSSPPPVFDPSFPEPVLQRGFLPSFGPPDQKYNSHAQLREPQNFPEQEHNHLPHPESPTSTIPLLRQEFPRTPLPDEVDHIAPTPEEPRKGKVYKHISVHVPAEDLEEDIPEPTVLKIQKKPEKHLKVIFIKPPESPTTKTEVEVGQQPQQKTLVYLLSESGGARKPIKLVKPAPRKPIPPQVYFLRYKDSKGATPTPSHAPGSEEDDDSEQSQSNSAETETDAVTVAPDVKSLSSPESEQDAELLRSAPAPISPTFSTFSGPSTTPISPLTLQQALKTPSVFTNYNLPNNNFQSAVVSQNNQNNNQLGSVQYNPNNFPPSFNPYPPNFYSSLFHLYPPPQLSSMPNQNQLSMYAYYNSVPQQNHLPHYQQMYPLDQSKSGTEQKTSSIQGLYSVARFSQNLPGNKVNSLVQTSTDGTTVQRTPRNFVMMTYAPTYMPSASSSEHVPVFTSPAAFIKSLLGDSYMYYNNIGNNTIFTQINDTTAGHFPIQFIPTQIQAITNPLTGNNSQPQHHRIPFAFGPNPILNFNSLQNYSQIQSAFQQPQPHQQPSSQPYAVLIGSNYGNNQNAKLHFPNPYTSIPAYHHSPTTTTTRQPRMSSFVTTAGVTPITTRKHIVHLPFLIYDAKKDTDNPSNVTSTVDTVSAHLNKILQKYQTQLSSSNDTSESFENGSSSKKSSPDYRYYSSSGSSESGASLESEDNAHNSDEDSSADLSTSINFEPIRLNPGGNYSPSSSNFNSRNSTGSPRPRNRKRVNPKRVKPGRRLRKVRKPNKSKRKGGSSSGEQENKSQS